MSDPGGLIIRLCATILGVAAMGAMAAALGMVTARLHAMRAGVAPAPWRQPWRDLVRLARKRRVRPEFASPLYAAWPVIAGTATAGAALIVPGFAFGDIAAPLATPILAIGLVAVAAVARIAAMLESGDAARGLRAAAAARGLIGAVAIWLTGFLLLSLQGGAERLGGIGAAVAITPGSALPVVLVGLALALSLNGFAVATPGDYAGPDRALFTAEALLRQVVLVSAVIDVVAPMPMADGHVIATWPLGLLAWVIKIAVLGVVLAIVTPRRFATRLATAALAAGLILMIGMHGALQPLLMGSGLIVGVAGVVLLMRDRQPAALKGLEAASLVQGGIALIGLGLAHPSGGIGPADGAVLILLTIGVTRIAMLLTSGAAIRTLCLIAIAGFPPFAGFAGDFAVVRSGFRFGSWLGVVMLIMLVVTAARLLRAIGPAPWSGGIRTGRETLAALLLLAVLVLGVAPWLIAGIA
jgi:formate hydrogenlyase subunit 4